MLHCKIINKTESGISLNWIRGGISIPKGCAAVLDYDPFSLMDRHSNVFFNAMADIESGAIEVEYSATAPFKMVGSIEEKKFVASIPEEKEHKHVENKLFREQEPYHKNEFEANVAKTGKAANTDPSEASFTISTPVTGETTKEATEVVSEAPAETTEAAPKTTRKKGGSKKL